MAQASRVDQLALTHSLGGREGGKGREGGREGGREVKADAVYKFNLKI